MNRKRARIHWAWVPGAVFSATAFGMQHGPVATVLVVLAGLGVGLYAERRARARTNGSNGRS
jgi:hypothetical protein